MAKIHLSRLLKRYDFPEGSIRGANYQEIMKQIIANNTENIGRATNRISSDNYSRQAKRVGRASGPKRVILPDVSEALPKRSVFIRKAADSGESISDTLRDRLTKDLRQSLNDFRTSTGEQAFVRRRGKLAGTINPKVIEDFEKRIVGTFEGYTRRDPRTGVPPNVHAIAVTEVRSTVNDVKQQYNANLVKKNPGMKMVKRWKHNRSLSKEPRRGHVDVDGQVKDLDAMFMVPLYDHNGRLIERTPMLHPHDPKAPPEQVIACNCDIEYIAELP